MTGWQRIGKYDEALLGTLRRLAWGKGAANQCPEMTFFAVFPQGFPLGFRRPRAAHAPAPADLYSSKPRSLNGYGSRLLSARRLHARWKQSPGHAWHATVAVHLAERCATRKLVIATNQDDKPGTRCVEVSDSPCRTCNISFNVL